MTKPFDMVNVQEDFNWHAALYDDCDNHVYRTPTTGGIGIGDGLNTLSNFPWDDLDRVTWTNRNGADALTPADSESDVEQMLSYIETNSAGNAVLVVGDTNAP